MTEGTPSDEVDAILAAGGSGVTTIFASMAARHPDGADADYLAWHTLDHRPEQYRLASLRSSIRLVSTPACRVARAASHDHLDATDHVMTYFFADLAGLAGFQRPLRRAPQRRPHTVRAPARRARRVRGVREARRSTREGRRGRTAVVARVRCLPARRIKRCARRTELIDVPGVAGTWSAIAVPVNPDFSTAPVGQRITYCFLDDDPVAIAEQLQPVLERRWNETGVTPLLAAPFRIVEPRKWDRYVP